MRIADGSDFGQLLKHLRLSQHLTQEELAERTGVSSRHIRNIEMARTRLPRRDTIRLLATGLGLDAQTTVDVIETGMMARHREPDCQEDHSEEHSIIANTSDDATLPLDPQTQLQTQPGNATPHNLALPLTRLIGRNHELAQINTQVLRPDVRLLTIVGAPGVGKTRLAAEVAIQMTPLFRDGVFYVSLSHVNTHALLASTIAEAVGVRDDNHHSRERQVTDYLHDKHMLIVLDNFEQLAVAAPMVNDLLGFCPDVKALVTSRMSLNLCGEWEYALTPLQTPDVNDLPERDVVSHIPSVELFLERVQQRCPSFSLTLENMSAIAAICAHLDGLPLALELAAPYIQVVPPALLLHQLEHRLSILVGDGAHRPAHQQTLRAALAWSYDLLSEHEQRLFRLLAIFTDSAPLDAVETLLAETPTAYGAVLHDLATLASKHLIQGELRDKNEVAQSEGVRFRLLETMREYGRELLRAHGEEQFLEHAHAQYYAQLLMSIEPHLRGSSQDVWLNRLERELSNVRATLRWALDHHDLTIGIGVAAGMWYFWYRRGYLSEGCAWLEKALALVDDPETLITPPVNATFALMYAKALCGFGTLLQAQGKLAQALPVHERCLRIRRACQDMQGVALTLNSLGAIAHEQGDYVRLAALHEESLQIFQALGDTAGVALVLGNQGIHAQECGEYARAATLCGESLVLFRRLERTHDVAFMLNCLGEIVMYRGEYTQATALCQESLAARQALRDTWGMAITRDTLGVIACVQGRHQQAIELFEQSLTSFRALHDQRGEAQVLAHLGDASLGRHSYEHAHSLYEQSVYLHRARTDRRGMAYALAGLGHAASWRLQYDEADTAFRESLAHYHDLGIKEGVALCLEYWGIMLTTKQQGGEGERSDMRRAAWILGAASALRTHTGAPLFPRERLPHRSALRACLHLLGNDQCRARWQLGYSTPWEHVLPHLLCHASRVTG